MNHNEEKELVTLALTARKNAYAPYSNYQVGAAVRTKSGKIFTGANVENAAYPMTMCGERNAIFQAVSQGERDFDTVVIATRNGGAPCGACRQVMSEFSLEMTVITVDDEGKEVIRATVRDLLPSAFIPSSLSK